MSESGYTSSGPDESDDSDPEETELWDAIQEAKDDEVVRPDQSFER